MGHHSGKMGLAEENFRMTVKCLQAMEIVTSLWQDLVSFRGQCRMDLSFRVQEVKSSKKVPKELLFRELNDWQRQVQTEDGFKLTRNKVGEYNGVQPRLHCELQLLKHPWTTDHAHVAKPADMPANTILPYIGCNKLSCYFCWKILQSLGLTTRNTHGKIRSSWAAPLDLLTEPNRQKAGDCLQEIHSQLEERLHLYRKNNPEESILRKPDFPASDTPFAPKGLLLITQSIDVEEEEESDDLEDEDYGYSEPVAEPEDDTPRWCIDDLELLASDMNT